MDLGEFHEETRRIVAQADTLRAEGLATREDLAKFGALMFKAGFTECQHVMTRLMKLLAFDGEAQ
jgi:uncharacterized membrane protein (UPF0127 family)